MRTVIFNLEPNKDEMDADLDLTDATYNPKHDSSARRSLQSF